MNELQQAYITMQNACGIKAGDKVKVLRKASNYEMGWANNWTNSMDDTIGQVFFVKRIDRYYGIELDGVGNIRFPFFVLEKIEDAPTEEMVICEMAKECNFCYHSLRHNKNEQCNSYCYRIDREVECIPVTEKPIDPIINFINNKCNFDCQQENVKKIVEMLLERIGK